MLLKLFEPSSGGVVGNKSCPWHGNDPIYERYHDEEWGIPCRDEAKLFEFKVLEGAQADAEALEPPERGTKRGVGD